MWWRKVYRIFVCAFVVILPIQAQMSGWHGGEKAQLPPFYLESVSDKEAWAVSDPALDAEAGKAQAVSRALFLLALQSPHSFQMLSEWYALAKTGTNSYTHQDEKINILLRLKMDTAHYAYQIVEQDRSIFGETFVRIKRTQGGLQSDQVAQFESFFCTVAQSHDHHDKRLEFRLSQLDTGKGEWQESNYQYRGDNYHPTILSTFQGSTQQIVQKGYWYVDSGTASERMEDRYPLKNGCWRAIIESLADALVAVEKSEVKQKTLSEDYDKQNQMMTREVSQGNLKAHPVILGIQDNHLHIQWLIELFIDK